MSIDYKGDFDFGDLNARLIEALPEALKDGGEVIGKLSDDKVPVLVDIKRANEKRRADPGELRDSRYVEVEGVSDVAIGYRAYWAGWQHERMDYHHVIGQAKFLEQALTEGKDEALQAVADGIREQL